MRWFETRVAVTTSCALNAFKTALQILAFWTVFYALLPAGIVWIESLAGLATGPSVAVKGIAALVFIAFGLLALSCSYQLVVHGIGTPLPIDAPQHFVVRGAYRYVRNPMALGSFAQGFAVALWHGSIGVAIYVYIGCLIWNYIARPWEERDLERRFGAAFLEYRSAVRCWIPRITPYKP